MSSNDPDQIRAEINRTRQEVSADVDVLGEKVSPSAAAQRQTDRVKEKVAGAKDALFGSAAESADRASSSASSARDAVTGAPHAAASTAKGNPLAVGLIGFGAGLLLSALIPASRAEQDAATRLKDSDQVAGLKDAAQGAAQDLMGSAKESAQVVAEKANEGVANVREEGTSAVQDVKASAQDSADTTKNSVS